MRKATEALAAMTPKEVAAAAESTEEPILAEVQRQCSRTRREAIEQRIDVVR